MGNNISIWFLSSHSSSHIIPLKCRIPLIFGCSYYQGPQQDKIVLFKHAGCAYEIFLVPSLDFSQMTCIDIGIEEISQLKADKCPAEEQWRDYAKCWLWVLSSWNFEDRFGIQSRRRPLSIISAHKNWSRSFGFGSPFPKLWAFYSCTASISDSESAYT